MKNSASSTRTKHRTFVFGLLSMMCWRAEVSAQSVGHRASVVVGPRLHNHASPGPWMLTIEGDSLSFVDPAHPGVVVGTDPIEQLVCQNRSCVIDTLRCTGRLEASWAIHGRRALRDGVSLQVEARPQAPERDRAFCASLTGFYGSASSRSWAMLARFAEAQREFVARPIAGIATTSLGVVGRGALNAGLPRSRTPTDPTAVLFTETSIALISATLQNAPELDPIVQSACGGSVCSFVSTRCQGEIREARVPTSAARVLRIQARPTAGATDRAFCSAISGDFPVQRLGLNPGARFWGVALGDWYVIPPITHTRTACLITHPTRETQLRVGSRCVTVDARRAQSWPGVCCNGEPEITVEFPASNNRNQMASHDPAPPIALSPDGAWLVVLPRQQTLSAAERAQDPVLVRAYARGAGSNAPREYRASALFPPSLPGNGAGVSFELSLDGNQLVSRVSGAERRVVLGAR